jgi:ADP-ribose pyrophosphatase YjhB (NUDIX family)
VNPTVRATAVLIENGLVLLVEQRLSACEDRAWSLPGGRVRPGETVRECLVREVREETGLDIAVGRLLYVCDRIAGDGHVVHITFAVRRVGGELSLGSEPEPDAEPIRTVTMVPLKSLAEYGFSKRFCKLAEAGFPDSGTYQGPVSNIGL